MMVHLGKHLMLHISEVKQVWSVQPDHALHYALPCGTHLSFCLQVESFVAHVQHLQYAGPITCCNMQLQEDDAMQISIGYCCLKR